MKKIIVVRGMPDDGDKGIYAIWPDYLKTIVLKGTDIPVEATDVVPSNGQLQNVRAVVFISRVSLERARDLKEMNPGLLVMVMTDKAVFINPKDYPGITLVDKNAIAAEREYSERLRMQLSVA